MQIHILNKERRAQSLSVLCIYVYNIYKTVVNVYFFTRSERIKMLSQCLLEIFMVQFDM